MASDDLRARIRRACAEADGFAFDSLEPHDYQGHADAVLGIVQPELGRERAERAIALARMESVRKLHRPTDGLGYGCDEDDTPGSYGEIAQVCTACGTSDEFGVRWPCPTVQALDDPPRGLSAPYCGAYMTEWVCTLPSGRHPDWRHVDADGNWWDQTRCPTDCGEPAYRHAANGCPEGPNTTEEPLS